MANSSQNLEQITLWLTKLALLTSGGKTPVTKQQIGLYAVTFIDDVPISVFTDASLNGIAGSLQYFPAYSALKTALEQYAPYQAQRASTIDGEFLPKWLHRRVMENCGNAPGPKLQAWLNGKTIEQ